MSTSEKKDWIDIFDSAYESAAQDYTNAKRGTPEEYVARICMGMFDYLSEAIKETLE